MVRTKEEIIDLVKQRIGENASDDDISFLEDVTDTVESFTSTDKAEEATEWERKYRENDAQWRERYIARFNGKEDVSEPETEVIYDEEKKYNFDDLFKEG